MNSWPPEPVSPPLEPWSTLTAPAASVAPTSSKGHRQQDQRSRRCRSRPQPGPSRTGPRPRPPPATWVNSCPPLMVKPAAEPYRTQPPATSAATASPGAPTARSAKPSLLKSPAARAAPSTSPISTAPPTRRWWATSAAAQPTPSPIQDIYRPSRAVLAGDANREVGNTVVVKICPHVELLSAVADGSELGRRRAGRCHRGRNHEQQNDQCSPSHPHHPPWAASRTRARLAFVSPKASHSATNLAPSINRSRCQRHGAWLPPRTDPLPRSRHSGGPGAAPIVPASSRRRRLRAVAEVKPRLIALQDHSDAPHGHLLSLGLRFSTSG